MSRNFVDEYFAISPDGSVIRTVKKGTNKISDWHDPLNMSTQRFSLTAAGLVEEEKAGPVSSGSPERVQGSTIRTASVGAPVKHWRFDEGIGDVTKESVDGSASTIAGHKSYWKKGVSGTALQFDGYNTIVALDPADSPDIADGLTLEAWIAIGAYPWNWCPIVQQGDDAGYALGIDAHAHAGFKLQVGGAFRGAGVRDPARPESVVPRGGRLRQRQAARWRCTSTAPSAAARA